MIQDIFGYTCIIEDEIDNDIFEIVLAQCDYKKLVATVHQSCKGMHDKVMQYRITGPDTSKIEYRFSKAFEIYQQL